MRAHFKSTYSDQLCISVVPETDDERRLLAAWIRLANVEGRTSVACLSLHLRG